MSHTPDDILDITQRTRKAIIDDMTKDGPPDNNRDRRLLIELMNGADTTALGMKRVDNESDAAKADALVATAFAALCGEMGNSNPFKIEKPAVNADVPTLIEGQVEDVSVVEGELDIGTAEKTYEEFMSQFDEEED